MVWEPILATDVVRPTTHALARVTDSRATQVWDPKQLIAKHMKQNAASSQMEPECCDEEGVWWDVIAVYAPGILWDHAIPSAAYVNGTVVRVSAEASDVIAHLADPRSAREMPRPEDPRLQSEHFYLPAPRFF